MFWWFAGIGAVISAIAIYRVLKGKAVLYYNGWDLSVSLIMIVAIFVLHGLAVNSAGELERNFVVAKTIIEIVSLAYHCFMAIWCNRNILDSFLTLITRMFFTIILTIIYIIGASCFIPGKKSERESDGQYMMRRVGYAALGVLILRWVSSFSAAITQGKEIMSRKSLKKQATECMKILEEQDILCKKVFSKYE